LLELAENKLLALKTYTRAKRVVQN